MVLSGGVLMRNRHFWVSFNKWAGDILMVIILMSFPVGLWVYG
jgi:hypothetical protein